MEGGIEDNLEGRMKALIFSTLFACLLRAQMSTSVVTFFFFTRLSFPLSSHFVCLSLSPLFHSFILSTPPLPLPFSVLLSHWDGSHVLWKPSEMKPHIGAVAGGRRRRRLQKKLCWRSRPRHRPETKLDVVKLSNYLRKLQQNLRRRKTERERSFFLQCIAKQVRQNGICKGIYDLKNLQLTV